MVACDTAFARLQRTQQVTGSFRLDQRTLRQSDTELAFQARDKFDAAKTVETQVAIQRAVQCEPALYILIGT